MGKLYNGSTPISKAYLGTSTVQKIYCGSTLIYPMYNTYTLTFSAATGNLTVTCNRISSPQAGAYTGNITSGSNIYTGDVLEFSAVASSGYYVYNTTQVTSSYSEQVTVSSDVTKSYKAVSRNTLTINTTSASFATDGKYIWSQTFNGLSNVETNSSNPYYPYMSSGLINGRISSATSSSVTCAGWVSSARQKIRGTAYYYSTSSVPVPEWHTILSSSFTPEPNESGQQVCSVSSSATKIRITTEWYAYNFSTQEENYIKEEQQEFSPSENVDFTFGASGFGYSEFTFYVNSNHVTVDSSIEEGETGVCYVTVTKVEAYY